MIIMDEISQKKLFNVPKCAKMVKLGLTTESRKFLYQFRTKTSEWKEWFFILNTMDVIDFDFFCIYRINGFQHNNEKVELSLS